ncbi:ABC transporter permease [Thermodesulfobacteriota bacterium]
MAFLDSFLTALSALRMNLMRSVLTTLGIIIGVAAVIIMVSVGAGAKARMDKVIRSLGSNLLMLVPGTGVSQGANLGTGTVPTLTEDDAHALENELEEVRIAAPLVKGRVQVVSGNSNWATNAYGLTPEALEAREWQIAEGRSLNASDVNSSAKVALLGSTVVEQISPDQSPVGLELRIRKVPFRVIGTLVSKGQTPIGTDQDDVVFVPITSARKRLLGGTQLGGKVCSMIVVKMHDWASVSDTVGAVKRLIRQRHRLQSHQSDDFSIRNLAEFLKVRASSQRTMSLLLAVVASVSLLVGGIGIMNIMLVSVTERTREIGLRMAVGADGLDILLQFLIESIVLSALGGMIGIAAGLGGSIALASLSEWPIVIKAGSVFLAFGFAAAVGIFFGFYPARKASLLNPIDALRFE